MLVLILDNSDLLGYEIKFENKKVSSISSALNSYEAQTYVMCTGYQTLLADIRKKELMMTPAKGYSLTFTMQKELQPKTTTLFADLFIVMTPRRDDVRMCEVLFKMYVFSKRFFLYS